MGLYLNIMYGFFLRIGVSITFYFFYYLVGLVVKDSFSFRSAVIIIIPCIFLMILSNILILLFDYIIDNFMLIKFLWLLPNIIFILFLFYFLFKIQDIDIPVFSILLYNILFVLYCLKKRYYFRLN